MIAALVLALAASSISGVVHDATGGAVSGAAVIIRVESGSEQRVTTGPDGRFSVDVAEARDVTVIVRAGGFAEKSERVTDVDHKRAKDPVSERRGHRVARRGKPT